MIDVKELLILISSTVFLSYISGIFYSKTKIPDIVWTLILGILLGPVLGVFKRGIFLAASPLMSVVALCIILFDAGINIDVLMLMGSMIKSLGLHVATLIGSILSIGFFLKILMPEDLSLLQAMLLGAMTGGTSTVAIYSIINNLEKSIPKTESARVLLLTESVISDPACIIVSMAILHMIMQFNVSIFETVMDIVFTLAFSSIFGFATGLLWILTMSRLKDRRFNYILTVAAIFPIYLAADHIGEGGGTVAVMAFGLAMSNFKYLIHMIEKLGLMEDKSIVIFSLDKERIRQFHEEITFFIKSFFFVYIGLIATLSANLILVGLGIVALSALLRYLVATGVGRFLKFSREELVLSRFTFANGLPALVMSQLPLIFDPDRLFFPNPEIYPSLCMIIVLGTVLYGALIGPPIAKWRLRKHDEAGEKT